MGERPELIEEGCRRAIEMGVYPFVVPLRPVPGTLMDDAPPPDPDYVAADLPLGVGDARRRGPRPRRTRRPAARAARPARGCRRGSASSSGRRRAMSGDLLVGPATSADARSAGCAARSRAELGAHFACAGRCSSSEQGIFEGDDRDGRDDDARHAARRSGVADGEVGGAVRLYPLDDDGLWKGDRLAVLPERARAPARRAARALRRRDGGRARRAPDGRADPGCRTCASSSTSAGARDGAARRRYHGVMHQPMAIALSATP